MTERTLSETISSQQRASIIRHVFDESPKLSNATGGNLPYYEIEIDSHVIKGARNWENRWDVIKGIVDYKDKSILDLGCNCGVLPVYLKKFRGPRRVLGIDKCPHMINGARLLAKYFDTQCEFKQVTIGQKDWEASIGSEFDIVFCMSLYMWIEHKPSFMKFLSKYPCVIFENHDTVNAVEDIKAVFRDIGFKKQKTINRLTDSTNTEYHRTTLLFQK